MAEGILGLGAGGGGLTNDVIAKIKAAETKSIVEPIEKDLEKWDQELEKVGVIEAKVAELLETIKPFDLFSSSATAFEQMSASTTGSSAIFDAADVGKLTPGTINVNITQLAQKDVFQSDAVNAVVKDTALGAETLTIQVGGGVAVDFDTTGKTYQVLADELNLATGISASVEQVGTDSYRLVIKSSDSGTDNALTITGTASKTLGYTEELDPIGAPGVLTEKAINHTLDALNMQGTIDNVAYDVSSNSVTTQGNLTITAVEIGVSTVSIQRDTSALLTLTQDFMTKYNELIDLIDEEAYSGETPLADVSSLKSMVGNIKDYLFADYGTADDKNVFGYGFELDKAGHLAINTELFAEAITDDFDGLKELFLGVAEDKGLGTQLKEFMDELTGFEGLLTVYDDNMAQRKIDLTTDKEDAIADLDEKYALMSSQFAAYGTVIAQMEASFGGLKMMIAQSTSSN